jgi:lipid A 3-O-deacylase
MDVVRSTVHRNRHARWALRIRRRAASWRPLGRMVLAFGLCLAAAGRAGAAEDLQLGPLTVMGDSAHYLEIGIGVFDALDHSDAETAGVARIELRGGDKLWFIGPALGLLATLDEAVLGYGGLYADIAIGPVVATPMLAVGGYAKGEGKDLGGVLQFRSSITLAYEFQGGIRLGAQFAHTSNAGLEEPNPGEEEVYLTVAWPF